MYRVEHSKFAERLSSQVLHLGAQLRLQLTQQADYVFRLLGKFFFRYHFVASDGLKSRRVSDIFIEQYVTGFFIEPWFGHASSPTRQ
jgi:hypothetical protein